MLETLDIDLVGLESLVNLEQQLVQHFKILLLLFELVHLLSLQVKDSGCVVFFFDRPLEGYGKVARELCLIDFDEVFLIELLARCDPVLASSGSHPPVYIDTVVEAVETVQDGAKLVLVDDCAAELGTLTLRVAHNGDDDVEHDNHDEETGHYVNDQENVGSPHTVLVIVEVRILLLLLRSI